MPETSQNLQERITRPAKRQRAEILKHQTLHILLSTWRMPRGAVLPLHARSKQEVGWDANCMSLQMKSMQAVHMIREEGEACARTASNVPR